MSSNRSPSESKLLPHAWNKPRYKPGRLLRGTPDREVPGAIGVCRELSLPGSWSRYTAPTWFTRSQTDVTDQRPRRRRPTLSGMRVR